MKSSEQTVLRLSGDDADASGRPGLLVQATVGPPPAYCDELYRLYLIEADAVTITLDNQQLRLAPGQLLALSPTERVSFGLEATTRSFGFHHDFFCIRVQRSEVYCDGIVFNRVIGSPSVPLPEDERLILDSRLDELRHIVRSPGRLAHERAISALRSILLLVADCKMKCIADRPSMADNPARISTLVLRFQDLVESHYADHKDLSFYCRALGVTASTLNRQIKRELGRTAMQAVNERLAVAARAALRSGRRSIKEVAFDLGFEDPLYFSRFFKKQFGKPPSQYFRVI